MNLKIINKIRTNNFNDPNIIKKIGDMWTVSLSDKLTDKKILYGVYYEYESNYKGDYTLAIAIEDKSEDSLSIPDNVEYEVFKVNTDKEQGILNAWNKIWKKEENNQIKRLYTYDFEKYYPNGEIDIFIAVK